MAIKFFYKKLLVYFILIIFSTNLYSAPPKRQNIDLKPFEIVLTKYIEICEKDKGKPITQDSINEMKKLLTPDQSDQGARSELRNCRNVMAITDTKRNSYTKDELTKDFKVSGAYYNPNKKAYVVSYYYYKYQEKVKSTITIDFRAIKDKNGNIVLKII